jgi:hypothetical protein
MRGPDRVPLEWVFLGAALVLLDVVYRRLHVRLRGAVSAVIVIMPPLLWLHTAEWAWWEVLPWFERR